MSIDLRRQSGISLVELIVFIVIVSVGIVGILSVMNVTSSRSADPMVRKQALSIAEAMLEEIELKNFADPGGPACAARNCFDDVGDYNGYQTTTGMVDIDGNAIGGLTDYNVTVAVNAAATLNGLGGGQVQMITVTVTGPVNEVITLEGYRTNYGL